MQPRIYANMHWVQCFHSRNGRFAFYAPTFVQRNNPCLNVEGPCENEWHFSQKSADLIFGIVVASSGLFGTALGGKIMDCFGGKKETSDEERRVFLAWRKTAWRLAWSGAKLPWLS